MLHILKPLLRRPLMPLLVVLQVALACAIACNALFLLRQKMAPLLMPDGVADPAHLLVLSQIVPRGAPWPAERLRAVRAQLQMVPDVKGVAWSASFPMTGNMSMAADVVGMPGTKANAAVYLGDNLPGVLGLRLEKGRRFTVDEEAVTYGGSMGFGQSGPVIITRALADRLFPDGHALGRLIRYPDASTGARTVVGVVTHLMRSNFTRENRELDYTMLFPGEARVWPVPIFAARISPAGASRACKPLTAVIQRELGPRLLPAAVVQCNTFAHLRNSVLAPQRAAVWLLSGVTLIVLIVTLTGIAGVTGYWVQQRTRSIGIRRALGARRSDVLCGLLIENLVVVGAGVAVGLMAAYGINFWLMRHYELLRLPVAYLPIGAGLLLVLGQLAVLVPARRASRIPPIVATRAL